VVALINQASQLGLQGAYSEALIAYASAVQASRQLGRGRLVAVLLNRIGDTFQTQGEIQDAVFAYEAALQSLETNEAVPIEAVIKRLSRVSQGFYSTPEAIPDLYSPVAQPDLETAEYAPTLAITLWLNLGNAYLRQPQLTAALNAYQQALQDPQIQTNPLLTAYATANLGEIYRRQRHLDVAEAKLNQAIQLFEAVDKPLEKRRALAFLAALKRNRHQPQAAIALFQQALSLYEQAQDQLGQAKTLAGLARLYLEQHRFAEAKANYLQAQELAKANHDREVLGYCAWGLGCCAQAAGELAPAIAWFEESLKFIEQRQQDLLSEESKVSFIDSIKDLFDRLVTTHLDLAEQTGNYDAALAAAESARGRALQDLMQGHQRRRPHPPAPTSPILAKPPLARLVFYVLSDRTAIFAVTANGQVYGHVSTLGSDTLEQNTARLRRALQVDEVCRGVERKLTAIADVPEPLEGPPLALETLLQSCYTDLITPVAAGLPTEGSTLVIEPHGALWLLPFAALQRRDGAWMGDCWPLVYAPSAQTFAEIRQEPSYATLETSKILIVGNPVMPKVPMQDGVELILSALPGAEAEARAIAEALAQHHPLVRIGAEATEAEVKERVQTYNWLHLATHGIAYTSDPLASFVAFSPTDTENGLLTAREVAQNRYLPADLVVLSACQTGLGRVSGDGMLGLCRAFLIAGARTVVVSQWSVSDLATAKLMLAFYQSYLHSGNKAIALQTAMQQVRSLPEYQHPRFWSAFLAVGDDQ
jgi:tetratricopeptide (TPR) repeat protein